MSQHLNLFSQKGCIGCKSCEGGSAAIGRGMTMFAIILFTGGLGLIILPFYKKCQYCGHNTWMNKHGAPAAAVPPASHYYSSHPQQPGAPLQ